MSTSPGTHTASTSLPGSAAEVRQRLLDALRLDLIGPDDTRPDLARETLPGTPPSRWYLTGFLAPGLGSLELRTSDDPDDEETIDAAVAEEEASDEESEVPRSKPVFPSSIGVSVLVGPHTRQLKARVRWATYRRLGASDVEVTDTAEQDDWRRTPHEATVWLRLGAAGDPVPLENSDGNAWGMRVRAVAREVPANERSGTVDGVQAVAVFVENARMPSSGTRDNDYAFQVELELTCEEGFVPRANRAELGANDRDGQIADLQYRDLAEWAVGHGVAADASVVDGACRVVRTRWIPEYAVPRVDAAGSGPAMRDLAAATTHAELAALLEPTVQEHRAWITAQRAAVAREGLDGRREQAARKLLGMGEAAADRISDGLSLLARDDVRSAFCAMNAAMAHAQTMREEPIANPRWRAFQIAFVLLNLRGLVDRTSEDRQLAELIYFPTGGGKTEAYLGVASFAMFWRRLARPDSYDGVAVLMRYTLRLLTLDQLGRAAALVCAMELARRTEPTRWGKRPFEIGLWVGGAATPNRIGDAKKPEQDSARQRVREYLRLGARGERPVPVEKCPWCHTPLQPESYAITDSKAKRPDELRVVCASEACPFSSLDDGGLPMLLVDENVYDRPPAFVIATVDKFAQLCWTQDSARLVGKPRASREGQGEKELAPPELFIQDELHLISGPLGTMVGAYEIALDTLARDAEGVGVKTITATATVRRAQQQVRALYGRNVAVFPPQGIHRDDAFFARTVPIDGAEEAGRLYVGVSAPGRSLKVVLLRTYATLLAAAQKIYLDLRDAQRSTAIVDPYLTVLGYFTSLRELGGSRRIVEDEVSARVEGSYAGRRRREESESLFRNRPQVELAELTSRESTAKVSETKQRLAVPVGSPKALDVALATNMISVGLDVTRLGLMVVLGRPKTTAEYIQATSRVGRDRKRPGLVITLFNPYRVRDRSHYERFAYDHAAFYRNVEAVSVTPFASRALDRAIAPVVVALARHTIAPLRGVEGAGALATTTQVAEPVLDRIEERVRLASEPHVVNANVQAVREQAGDVLDAWHVLAAEARGEGRALVYHEGDMRNAARLLRDPLDPDAQKVNAGALARMRAPWSLRDVEASAAIKVLRGRGR